jgi:hypothetical protein
VAAHTTQIDHQCPFIRAILTHRPPSRPLPALSRR